MDHWKDRLSEYLDGALSARESTELEWHLQTCLDCRRTLGELREVVARAQTLPDVPPSSDPWPALAARIQSEPQVDLASLKVIDVRQARATRRPLRITFTVPQLAAASIALMLFSSGVVWFAQGRPGPTGPAAERGAVVPVVDTRVTPTEYAAAVQSLEAALREKRAVLDPVTVAVLEENLRVIDAAVTEAKAALESDPGNLYLNQHLENTLRKKIQLLRQATGLRGVRS